MNKKEISEIRGRFKTDKSNISNIRGCYVNEKREIISRFSQTVATMPEDEAEKFLGILKRTLSGTPEKNLINIEFSTKQVMEGAEHKLLMDLRSSSLKDEDAVEAFFSKVIESVVMEDNYLILLAQDVYDVPFRSQGEKREDSAEVFTYLVCSICPVKMTKPVLSYHVRENEFHSRTIDRIVSPPEMGFMFPAFDDRQANIYGALYYTRNISDNHTDFVDSIFNCEIPQPAAVQKETFQTVLSSSLSEECSLDIIQSVQGRIEDLIEEHKEDKEAEPLKISKGEVVRILKSSGVSEDCAAQFEEKFDYAFGADTALSPPNIIETKKCEVTTPDVKIQINAERSELVETRIINGTKYILIRAEEGVELNGIPIHIADNL